MRTVVLWCEHCGAYVAFPGLVLEDDPVLGPVIEVAPRSRALRDHNYTMKRRVE